MADDLIALAGDFAFERKRLSDSLRRLEGLISSPSPGVHGELDQLSQSLERLASLTLSLVNQVSNERTESMEGLVTGAVRTMEAAARELERPVTVESRGGGVRVERDTLLKLEPLVLEMMSNLVEYCIEPPKERAARGKPPTARVQIDIKPVEDAYRLTVACDGNGLLPPRSAEHGKSLAETGIRAQFEGKSGEWSAWIFLIPASHGAFRAVPMRVGQTRICIPSWAVLSMRQVTKVEEARSSVWGLSSGLDRGQITGAVQPGSWIVELGAGTRTITYLVDEVLEPEHVFMKPLAPALAAGGRYLGVVLTEKSDNQLSIVIDPAYLVYGGRHAA